MNRHERRGQAAQQTKAGTAFATAMDHHRAGRLPEAIAAYRRAVAAEASNAAAHYHLGLALFASGQIEPAATALNRALKLNPNYASALLVTGNIAEAKSDYAAAYDLYRRAAVADPKYASAHLNAGLAALTLGDRDAGLAHLRQAAALPTEPALSVRIRRVLGTALAKSGDRTQLAEAEHELREAHRLAPDNADAMNNLGLVLHMRGRLDEARQWLVRATTAAPEMAAAHANLGLNLRALGAFDEAIASLRRALELDANQIDAHGNLLFCLQFHPATTPQSMLAEARRWNRFTANVQPLPPPPPPSEPERRLRIGYVSPDFCEHACAHYIEPLIAAHDRDAFEIFCYAEVRSPDEITNRIRATAAHWRQTPGMSHAALAAAIRADGVDILVDLAGHTRGNRLMAFVHRPAPIQVATMIGYSTTTGVAAFDYVLGDPYLTPEGCDADYSETIVRLPDHIAPFLPRNSWPAPAAAPEGPVVFGSVAHPARTDQRTIALWRRLLTATPGSRVLAKHNLFDDAAARDAWRSRLGDIADRVDSEGLPGGWGANMGPLYERVSMILDSPMHSGNTTVLIPLWMGVPVVTLAGPNGWQRAGASILSHAGLPDLVAHNDDEYVEIATRVAADRDRLSRLRRELRDMMLNSPVCHPRKAVAGIEAAYRAMWRKAVTAVTT